MLNGVSKLAKLLASDDIKRRKRGHKYVRELLSTRSGVDEFEMSYMDILGVCKGLFYSLWMQDKLLLQEEVVRKIVGLISSIKSKDIRSMYIKATFDILSREWGNLDVWRQDKFMMLARDFFVRCLLSLKRRGINQETFMAAVFQCVLNASIDVAMDLKLHLINVIKEELPKSDVKPTLLYSFFKNALETLLSIPRGSTYASSMIYLLLFLAGKMRRFKKLPLMEISEGLLLLSTKGTGYSKTLKRLSKAFHVKQALVKEDGSAEKQGSVGNEAMKIDEPAAMKTDEPEGFSVVTPIASPRKRKFESESAEAAPDPISRKRKRRRKGKEVDVSSSLSEETPFSVALRALGHEVDAKENEALKLMFPDGTVIFEEYLHMMSQWILSVDQDLDVKKAFSLFDSDAKGYINLNDLRRVRDLLGYGQEIDDSELTDMLLGAQVKDSEQELKEIYEARQDKTRLRKGQGHVTAEEARAAMAQGALDVAVGGAAAAAAAAPALPPPSAGASHRRRVSSSFDSEATDLCVDLDKFKRVLQLESAPPEPI